MDTLTRSFEIWTGSTRGSMSRIMAPELGDHAVVEEIPAIRPISSWRSMTRVRVKSPLAMASARAELSAPVR